MTSRGKSLKGSVKAVLEFIEKFIAVKDEKSMSLSSMEVITYYAILEKTVEFDLSISDYEKSNIVRQAIYDSIKDGGLNEKSFFKNFNRHHLEVLNSVILSFRVITQLSIDSQLLPNGLNFTLNGVRIKLMRSLPKAYQKSRKIEEDNIGNYHGKASTPHDVYCVSYVSARSPQEAYHKAFHQIEIVRAALNFSYNLKRKHLIKSYGPENYVFSGPTHTVHSKDGEAFSDLTHYEPEYTRSNRKITNLPNANLFTKNCLHIVNQVKTLKIGKWVGHGLTMYVEALDIANPKLSFTMLWSVLEHFTVTDSNYSDTVKKASSIWNDHELVKSLLLVLRESRNDFVHKGVTSKTSADYLEILRGILDKLILFTINIPKELDDLAALEEYLNLPRSNAELNAKLLETKKQASLIQLKLKTS